MHVDLAATVKVYKGFKEEASRLVFHYSDRFGHLGKMPELLTILPSGVIENEPRPLRIREEQEEKGNEHLLKNRAIATHPSCSRLPTGRRASS